MNISNHYMCDCPCQCHYMWVIVKDQIKSHLRSCINWGSHNLWIFLSSLSISIAFIKSGYIYPLHMIALGHIFVWLPDTSPMLPKCQLTLLLELHQKLTNLEVTYVIQNRKIQLVLYHSQGTFYYCNDNIHINSNWFVSIDIFHNARCAATFQSAIRRGIWRHHWSVWRLQVHSMQSIWSWIPHGLQIHCARIHQRRVPW